MRIYRLTGPARAAGYTVRKETKTHWYVGKKAIRKTNIAYFTSLDELKNQLVIRRRMRMQQLADEMRELENLEEIKITEYP